MFFKNLQAYRLLAGWPGMTAEKLSESLSRRQFHPCGSRDFETRGWAAPFIGANLAHDVGGHWLVCLETETKLLPASVIRQTADERAEEIAEQQGYKLGRKQMKELREQITQELLPRAFVRRRRTYAWIDPAAGWLVVDASSPARAEDVLEALRDSLDSFPLALLRTERSPCSAMADWLAADEAPAGFTIDLECHLRDVRSDAEVSYRRALAIDHIQEQVAAGKLPTRLAMTFDDRISFVLTEKLEMKRVDFLDVVRDQLDGQGEDYEAVFNAEFALMTGELGRLLPAVVEALGGELARAPDLVDAAEASERTADPAPYLPDFDGEPAADPLYTDARRVVIETGRPSISLVQRHLRIGYSRAACLIEQMERDGIVSALKADGTREVLAA